MGWLKSEPLLGHSLDEAARGWRAKAQLSNPHAGSLGQPAAAQLFLAFVGAGPHLLGAGFVKGFGGSLLVRSSGFSQDLLEEVCNPSITLPAAAEHAAQIPCTWEH